MKKYFRTIGMVCSISIVAIATVFSAGCGTEKPKEKTTKENVTEEIISEEVNNNGSFLVTVGDVLYFRDYPVSSMETVSIGKGHMGKISAGKKSHICSYDKTTGKVTKLAEDEYGGKLYYSGDAIYTNNENSDAPQYAKISLKDGSVKELGEGRIDGISEDGALLAIEEMNNNNENKITVVRTTDQSQVTTIEKKDALVNYIGFYKNSLVYEWDETVIYDSKKDEKVSDFSDYYAVHHICQQDLNCTDEVSLGTITLPFMEDIGKGEVSIENGNATVKGYRDIYFNEGIISGNQVGVSYQVAEGTGSIFSYGYIASATLGQADSLEQVEYIRGTAMEDALPDGEKGNTSYDEMPQIWFDKEKKLVCGMHRWNSAYLSGNTLIYIDENGKEQEVTKEYATEDGSDTEISQKDAFDYSETFVVDGEKIYSVREKIQRKPEDDAGWREAFELKQLEYCEISIADGSVKVFQVEV